MYHEGELSVQRKAGVAAEAGRVGRIIGKTIPPVAADFIEAQSVVIASTIDGEGLVWATPLAGSFRADDPRTLRIRTSSNLKLDDPRIGLLAIEFGTRRRIRINGRVTRAGDDYIVTTDEVYSNCPKYIHPQPARPDTSSPERWIATSDTFFIATANPNGGADVSHRGGEPGFVRSDGSRITFPDYPGNNMFNTLGNLETNPNCGLLFLDFAQGKMLQISGKGRIEWEPERRVVIERITQPAHCFSDRRGSS